MTDTKMLREKINESGMTIQFIADKLSLSRCGFYKKLHGENGFKQEEIKMLKDVLHLTRAEMFAIFFAD